MKKAFDKGVCVGHYGTAFDRNGKPCRVFIPRRDQDIAADRATYRDHDGAHPMNDVRDYWHPTFNPDRKR